MKYNERSTFLKCKKKAMYWSRYSVYNANVFTGGEKWGPRKISVLPRSTRHIYSPCVLYKLLIK